MTLAEAFAQQGKHCEALGSPFMGRLMQILAKDWPADSALGRKFDGFVGDVGPAGHSLPLRIAGGLHALVLRRLAPELAAVYPPASAPREALRDAVVAALAARQDFLLAWTDSPPQTNEVRRSAALIAGAHVAVRHFDLPIRLSELGASAGLNMMWDHYALELAGERFGPDMPTIVLTPEWRGPMPPRARPRIEARAGVDLNPLRPQQNDDLTRLTAYLWPDQPERLRMTRAAASVARTPVVKGDAIDWLAPRLHSAPEGRLHLIQNTIAWQYFPKSAQARGRAMIEAAGLKARAHRPLAWLSMEGDGGTPGAALTLRLWPGNLTLALGRVDFHGRWVEWTHAAG